MSFLGSLTCTEPVASVNLAADSDKPLFILHLWPVCVCACVCSTLAYHHMHPPGDTHTPTGRCFKAWHRCRLYCFVFHVSSILPPSSNLFSPPSSPILTHSLLMAQMWQWHTGGSLRRRQHKAVISIFKHFGRRRFHVICNQTSVQPLKLTMLLV